MSLHNQAEAYGCKPSEILGLETPWGSWQLNEVALIVGRRVERNMNNGKVAFDGFGQALPAQTTKRGYRNAKMRVTKKMKIPASGIW